MAGKGGGAWKVAYADFVTAMMAFFLVMWIMGQDQKIRKAVSFYFNDPTSTSMVGTSKRPSRSGAVEDTSNLGSVPDSESAALGRGRKSHTLPETKASATKLISDHLAATDATMVYWEQQGKRLRKWAAEISDVKEKKATAEEVASLELARMLRLEVGREVMGKAQGVQQDLLAEGIASVNWLEIAEDLLNR